MKKHKLGFGHGSIIEGDDGTASVRPSGQFTAACRVRIADVTGFAVDKGDKMMQRKLRILGNGTELASVDVNHGTAEKIEAWFRAHPAFSGGAVTVASQATPAASAADELAKLAALREQGVLTDDEFAAQKAKLLG